MVVTIRDFELNFPNGTDASLFAGFESEFIIACKAKSSSLRGPAVGLLLCKVAPAVKQLSHPF